MTNYILLFTGQAEEMAAVVTQQLFRPSKARQYAYIGNCIRGVMNLLQDYKHNQQYAEAFGWLAVKLVECSRTVVQTANDDESVDVGRVMSKVKNLCAGVASLQDVLRKW